MPTRLTDKLGISDRLGIDRLGIDRLLADELEETILGSAPLLAVVGAGDLALELLRAARADLAARSASFDAAAFREQARASLIDRLDALQSEIMSAPEHLVALPEKAQEMPMRAQSLLADLVSAAFSRYGELTGRGKAVVTESRLFTAAEAPDAFDDEAPVTRPVAPVGTPVTGPAPATGDATAVARATATKAAPPTKAAKSRTVKATPATVAKKATPATVAKKATASRTAAASPARKTTAAAKKRAPAKGAAGSRSAPSPDSLS